MIAAAAGPGLPADGDDDGDDGDDDDDGDDCDGGANDDDSAGDRNLSCLPQRPAGLVLSLSSYHLQSSRQR